VKARAAGSLGGCSRLCSPSYMARASAPAPLDALAERFSQRVAKARRQLGSALVVLGLVAGALVARQGTGPSRALGALLLLSGVALLAFVLVRARRTLQSRRRLIAATLSKADADLGARALRALSLVERGGARPDGAEAGESVELAQLHLQRVLARAPTKVLDDWATRSVDRTRLVLLATIMAAGVALALDPARVLEGLDVMVARGGRAPVPMFWLGSLRVESEPPAYLRAAERRLFPQGIAHEPVGSVITFIGVPEREGRRLVLVGDDREVPFVSDGTGAVAARWVLSRAVSLRVAARFGDVLITEPDALELRPVADLAPEVELEGAPRSIALKDLQALELRYDVNDDYGLREVALVLRSAGREDRRTLERLDGEAKQHKGAQALSPRDGFVRRSFLPVEVAIEARDNDAVLGAKWGKSQAITLVPAGVGEGEAARYAAFKAARAALVDAYAQALREGEAGTKTGAVPPSAGVQRKRQAELLEAALGPLRRFVGESYPGVAEPKSLKSFLQGQARALERPAPTRETFLRRLEDVALAVDAALRATGNRDAETVAKRLGDVAEEVAEGAKLGRDPEQRKAARARLGPALPVLEKGAASLLTLADLGADLGSVTQGELGRIKRGLQAESYWDAELAARHLAARLRRPKPSFSSAGGGGVEAGGGQGSGRGGAQPPQEASPAHRQFQELMRELQQLSAEHQGQVSAVESALESAEQATHDPEIEREAKQRADALRKAFEALPDYAPGQTLAEQAAALAREHARAMAESLSRLSLKDAQQSAESAQQKLSGARSSAGQGVSSEDLESAERVLKEQRAWVEDLLQKARERAEARAKEALESLGRREQELAERAQNLSGRGSHGEAALPGEVAEALDRAEALMREAARELSSGRGERGAELQREAQRWLERQDDEQQGQSEGQQEPSTEPRSGERSDEAGELANKAPVPGRDKNQRAEEFRERVLKGLSRDKGGRLGPAVKRYAEGLLK
jgi:Domain of unknown function (DUF4175)